MIPLTRPVVGAAEAEAAGRSIRSGELDAGQEVVAFERDVAAYVGAAHACAVSSGPTALTIALDSVGVRAGDEVVTASTCGVAAANAILRCGARPVFVDLEPDGLNIDAASLARTITSRTRAIVATHAGGMPCDLAAILPPARARGIAVVEDASAALGSEILHADRWSRIGSPHGDVAVFSFRQDQVIATGEGGMLTTNRPDLDAAFRSRRLDGVPVPDETARGEGAEGDGGGAAAPAHPMTDIQAAIGRQQMRRLSALVARRRSLAERYAVMLQSEQDLSVPQEPWWARSNWQSYCVHLARHIDRKRVEMALREAGVATGRPVAPVEATQAGGRGAHPASRALEVHRHGLLLPLFVQMSDSEQQRVVRTLLSAVRQAHAAGRRLMLVKR